MSPFLPGRQKEIPKGVDQKNLILFGDCVKKFRDQGLWVEGCPPGEPFPLWTITDRKCYAGLEDTGFNTRERMAKETPQFLDYMMKKRAELDSKSQGKGKKK